MLIQISDEWAEHSAIINIYPETDMETDIKRPYELVIVVGMDNEIRMDFPSIKERDDHMKMLVDKINLLHLEGGACPPN